MQEGRRNWKCQVLKGTFWLKHCICTDHLPLSAFWTPLYVYVLRNVSKLLQRQCGHYITIFTSWAILSNKTKLPFMYRWHDPVKNVGLTMTRNVFSIQYHVINYWHFPWRTPLNRTRNNYYAFTWDLRSLMSTTVSQVLYTDAKNCLSSLIAFVWLISLSDFNPGWKDGAGNPGCGGLGVINPGGTWWFPSEKERGMKPQQTVITIQSLPCEAKW